MDRNTDFRALPGFSDFLATMLQDLQYNEMDNACTEEREEADVGTIYTLRQPTYDSCLALYKRFASDNVWHIQAALDLVPGEESLRYANDRYVTPERIGSTLYLAVVGHGVGFTDDGDAPCLVALDEWARANSTEFYFDGEGVYIS